MKKILHDFFTVYISESHSLVEEALTSATLILPVLQFRGSRTTNGVTCYVAHGIFNTNWQFYDSAFWHSGLAKNVI